MEILTTWKQTMRLPGSIRINRDIEELAEELASRWAPFFVPKDWRERLDLLKEMHEQLQEDIGDMDVYCAISPILIRKLIEKLSNGPVTSIEQVHIYANSAAEEHRRAAGEWLAQHRSRDSTA